MGNFSFSAQGEQETCRIAGRLAAELRPGDVVALTGDLGAGKTVFSRSIVRALSGQAEIEVPSPTFTLVQTYDSQHGGTIYHADLYRLGSSDEFEDLGLDDDYDTGIFLVEWPDRLPANWLDAALHVTISIAEKAEESRTLSFVGAMPSWRGRLDDFAASIEQGREQ